MFKPPAHLIDQWPEVFSHMEIDSMPVAYIEKINLTFNDGSIWELNIAEQLVTSDPTTVVEKIYETLEDHAEEISKIDFDMDVERLKLDIEDRTKNIL